LEPRRQDTTEFKSIARQNIAQRLNAKELTATDKTLKRAVMIASKEINTHQKPLKRFNRLFTNTTQ
jgi:hypothetical protein